MVIVMVLLLSLLLLLLLWKDPKEFSDKSLLHYDSADMGLI